MDLLVPSLDEVLEAHAEILKRTGGSGGLLQRGSLEAALDRAANGPFARGGTLAERAALLLRGIGQDHPFADGNKRTALAAAESFLRANGVKVDAGTDELVEFMLRVARIEIDVAGIEAWIAGRLRKD